MRKTMQPIRRPLSRAITQPGDVGGDTTPGGASDALLLESDDGLLLESGDFLLLESN